MDNLYSETWFYGPTLEKPGDASDLPDEEAHHIGKVLRLRPGSRVIASNGRGSVFRAVYSAARGSAELTAESAIEHGQAKPRISMLLCLLKGRDLEDPVEGLVQLELSRISLLISDHTQVFKGQDHGRLVERLRAKSVAGLKQAKKAWLTAIDPPETLPDWRKRNPGCGLVMLHPGPDRLPSGGDRELAFLCGPEGGFSERELAWLENEAAYRMDLGPTRLRATHAPLIACGKWMGLRTAPVSDAV